MSFETKHHLQNHQVLSYGLYEVSLLLDSDE